MHRIFRAFLWMAVGSMLAAAPLHAADKVMRISSDPWEPWVLGVDGSAAIGGSAVKMAEEIFKRLGLKTEIMIYPYERCIHQMQKGERDVLLMVKKTPEREAFMLFSDVAATDPQLIYFSPERLNGFAWNSWEDLQPYTVGGVLGFNYGDFNVAAQKLHINTEMTEGDIQNIKKLLSGRVDLIMLNRATANYYMEQNPEVRGKMKAAEKVISNAEFHFALSKKGQATPYLAKINAALHEMKADGTTDKILGLSE